VPGGIHRQDVHPFGDVPHHRHFEIVAVTQEVQAGPQGMRHHREEQKPVQVAGMIGAENVTARAQTLPADHLGMKDPPEKQP
jgi:hypothetical protein